MAGVIVEIVIMAEMTDAKAQREVIVDLNQEIAMEEVVGMVDSEMIGITEIEMVDSGTADSGMRGVVAEELVWIDVMIMVPGTVSGETETVVIWLVVQVVTEGTQKSHAHSNDTNVLTVNGVILHLKPCELLHCYIYKLFQFATLT